MKKVTFLCLLFFSLFILNANAQISIPKVSDVNKASSTNVLNDAFSGDILKALNPDKTLGLSSDQQTKLTENNKGFVDNVLGILGGSGTDEEKEQKIGVLQNERKDFIENLLGEGKASQYYKLVKKKVEPLVKKYAMAKFFM